MSAEMPGAENSPHSSNESDPRETASGEEDFNYILAAQSAQQQHVADSETAWRESEIASEKRKEFEQAKPSEETKERGINILKSAKIEGDEFKGRRVTHEVLEREGLYPNNKIQLGDSTICFSSAGYNVGSDRVGIVGYIEKGGQTVAHSFYRDTADGVWRYVPDTREVDNQLTPGTGFSAESVAVPFHLQKTLAEIAPEKTPITTKADPELLLAGTAKAYGEFSGSYYQEVEEPPERLGGNIYSSEDDPFSKIAPGEIVIDADESPNFTSTIASWDQDTGMYGKVTAEVYASKNGKLQYLFYRDAHDRTWIGGIENDSEIQSMGLRKKWVEGGNLIQTPLAYKKGLTDETGGYGNDAERNGDYVDMYQNYISKIPVIQEYGAVIAERKQKQKEVDGLRRVRESLNLEARARSEHTEVLRAFTEEILTNNEGVHEDEAESPSEPEKKETSTPEPEEAKPTSTLVEHAGSAHGDHGKSWGKMTRLEKAKNVGGYVAAAATLAGGGTIAWGALSSAAIYNTPVALILGTPLTIGGFALGAVGLAGIQWLGISFIKDLFSEGFKSIGEQIGKGLGGIVSGHSSKGAGVIKSHGPAKAHSAPAADDHAHAH